jgi:hypothetical protein
MLFFTVLLTRFLLMGYAISKGIVGGLIEDNG